MRRGFSDGFLPSTTRVTSSMEADDTQVRRFKQILLEEVDLQELSRTSAGRAWNGCSPTSSRARA
jgi:pilus assembly protein CpaF